MRSKQLQIGQTMSLRGYTTAICFGVLAGSAEFPNLTDRVSDIARNAPYPVILTLPELQAIAARDDGAEAEALILAARAAELRTRAKSLSGPVLTAAERTRLKRSMLR